MKNSLFVCLCLALWLTACQPASMSTLTATLVPSNTASATEILPTTASPTQSQTPLATQTQRSSPSPTVLQISKTPTSRFTPTFDIRTVVTVTSAPKAECPKEDPAITINLTAPLDDIAREFQAKRGHLILDALNEGLSISTLNAKIKTEILHTYYQDVTGDGVKDFILSDYGSLLDIFYCVGGKYELFALEDNPEFYPWPFSSIWEIIDRNQNGLPEIVFYQLTGFTKSVWIFHIYEWDGKTFVDLTDDPESDDRITSFQPKGATKEDVNHDGLTDLVFTDGGPSRELGLWSRVKTTVYSWNGKFYVKSYVSRAKPQYRYQAIQDGDRETLYGHYQKAIGFYQEAIFNADLDWMSFERAIYQIKIDSSQYDQPTPTPYPTPLRDESEYPRLAAYAYYRMIILHTYLGEIDAAQTQYATLQQKFPSGSPGYPYAEMASRFWDAYQASDNVSTACTAAIKYTDQHPDILAVLEGPNGNDSLSYISADICPFR